MKGLLAIVSLLVSGVLGDVSEVAAPYPPSGWRPSGPTLELPQRAPAQRPQKQEYLPPLVDPRNQNQAPQKQEYLPPTDPRNTIPDQTYGTPDVDVSVQGLPAQEQLPIFQLSPINGQQFVGPTFNADLRSLDQSYRQVQYQPQQDIYRQFARQRQQEEARTTPATNSKPSPKIPREFVRTTPKPTTTSTTSTSEDTTTTAKAATFNLNDQEVLEELRTPDTTKNQRVTVEVTKQNIQEYPADLFLAPLAQLKLQQLTPVQLGQIRAPVYFQPNQEVSQKQISGYDANVHFSALPSVLAQQQLQQQVFQNQVQLAQGQPPFVQGQTQFVQAQPQQASAQPQFIQGQVQAVPSQQGFAQNPAYLVPQQQSLNPGYVVPTDQQFYQPALNTQFETVPVQSYQIQAQPVVIQQQGNQVQSELPRRPENEQEDQDQPQQPQFSYQQPQFQQGQYPGQLTPQDYQQQLSQQQLYYQQQLSQQQILQQQLLQQQQLQQQLQQQQFFQQQVSQGQDGSLHNGLDGNQQGNGVDQNDKEDEDDGSTVTAVATAFGTRTQPRVYTTYGAPAPVNPGDQTTTETQESATDDGQAEAEAAAVARAARRKSAKLRSRRVRPVFTLDRSGHLVLSQEQ